MFLTWLSIPVMFAQNAPGSADQEQNLRMLGNLTPYSPGAVGFDNRYEGIQGSPFLFDMWTNGQVQFVKQDTLSATFQLNVDLVRQVVTVKLQDGTVGEMSALTIQRLQTTDPASGQTQTFLVATENEIEGVKSVRKKFYEVLHQGAFNFLKETLKKFRKADFEGPYSADRRYDEFLTEEKHWLQTPDKPYKKVRPRKRDIEKALADYEKQVDKLVKTHKLHLNQEKDIATLLEFLETSER